MATQAPARLLASVVSFDSRSTARFVHSVYQEELANIVDRRARLRRDRKELEQLEEYVTMALKAGATVEPGQHSPEILAMDRSGYSVPAGKVTKLVIR